MSYEDHFFFFQNIANFILIPKMQKKMLQKIYGFLDNLAEFGNAKFSLLIPEYS